MKSLNNPNEVLTAIKVLEEYKKEMDEHSVYPLRAIKNGSRKKVRESVYISLEMLTDFYNMMWNEK